MRNFLRMCHASQSACCCPGVPLSCRETLVSTTDLQGRILYCNPMFVEVSGYAKGKSCWGSPTTSFGTRTCLKRRTATCGETIGKGIPWSAPVKNRRKDGTYYWVMAQCDALDGG